MQIFIEILQFAPETCGRILLNLEYSIEHCLRNSEHFCIDSKYANSVVVNFCTNIYVLF